jgi:NADPH-dependent 2,4-dienoyl-CoA reductase/sulfur reductase-like enzyme
MEKFELVIAGGGLTAARAIKSFREAGGEGRVALFSSENVLPYHRPALSKRYLRGETVAAPFAEDESFYREHGVDVLLDTAVSAVDGAARTVTAGGDTVGYDRLLVATGATPRLLGAPGADLTGVFSLRTLHDSDRIRAAATTAENAVVVGGGFIGMEVAASLRGLGLQVTLIHAGPGLFDQFRSPQLSRDLLELYRGHGVDVRLEEEVAAFGGDNVLQYVGAMSGLCVEADMAVVGVGVVPNTSFLAGSGVAIDNGIVVDERFRSTVPGIYAAGDVANFYDPLYGRRRRIEHWSNANYQGAEVGKVLAGAGGGYDAVSSFFSEIFGTTIKVFGDVGRFDEQSSEGSLASGRLLTSYGYAGLLVGALTIGQSSEVETLVGELIREQAPTRPLHDDLIRQAVASG